jgi:hypothetical protein
MRLERNARANVMDLAGRYIPLTAGVATTVWLTGGSISEIRTGATPAIVLPLLVAAMLIPAIVGLAAYRWRHGAGILMMVAGVLLLGYSVLSGWSWWLSVPGTLLVAAGVCTVVVWQREGGSLGRILLRATVYIKIGLAMFLWAAFAFVLALAIAYPDPEGTFHSRLFTLTILGVTFFGWALFVFLAAIVEYAKRR